jgi:hypothetical protein
MYKYFLLSFLLWILNLEISIGKVWIRPNEYGKNIFAYKNIFSYMVAPLKMKEMWYFQMWDVNIFTFTIISGGYIYLIREYLRL